MVKILAIGIIMLMLASGFIVYNYDSTDDGVKILNDDDYKNIEGFIGTPTPIPSGIRTPENLEKARSFPVGQEITTRRPTVIKEVEN